MIYANFTFYFFKPLKFQLKLAIFIKPLNTAKVTVKLNNSMDAIACKSAKNVLPPSSSSVVRKLGSDL